jgi:hypothetical protein
VIQNNYPRFDLPPVIIRSGLTLLLFCVLVTGNVYSQDDLDVIKNKWLEFNDSQNALYHHLTGEAYDLLKQRAATVSGYKDLSDWQKRQERIRETLIDIVGPLPAKTPLNAVITRTITREKYIVQNIIFESQPGFYVTSSLFIPAALKKGDRAPAIIYCSGHSADGYRSAVYQHVILNLVFKGFIVFAFDPVGQGERLEYYDTKTGKSVIGGPTSEHSYPGAQAFIAGSSQALYMIWDGIRAVDYLLTRTEVDPARIGITGRSGGGTQTAYIAAMDDRIYAAAPENYLTNYTRLLQSIGPQDAEQNLFNIVQHGLDHPDFLIVRAPRPALMITTSGDMFSIQGAVETEKEVARIYKAFNKSENFSRVEDDAGHASTLKNRESMYAFFRKHLKNQGDTTDEEIKILSPEELQVTKTGQVSTSLGGETVFSLNRRLVENLEAKLNKARENPDNFLPLVIQSAKDLSGYNEPVSVEDPVFTGRVIRNGYVIEKYFVKGEGEYIIPYLLFRPDKPSGGSMLYLHPGGKSAEAARGGDIEKFVNNGITVLAPDLPGRGEMGPGLLHGDAYFDGVSHNIWYASMLIGRSITGILAGDVVRLVRILKQDCTSEEISGYAGREMAQVLLHAAAFTGDLDRIILVEPFSSYNSIVMNRFYNTHFIPGSVPGALREYDLPDLAATLAPRKFFISGMTDGNSSTEDSEGIRRDIDIIRTSYRNRGAEKQLKILSEAEADRKSEILLDWLKN